MLRVTEPGAGSHLPEELLHGRALKTSPCTPQVTNYSSPNVQGDGSPDPPDKPILSVSSYPLLSIPLISSTAEFWVRAKLDSETSCPGISYFKDPVQGKPNDTFSVLFVASSPGIAAVLVTADWRVVPTLPGEGTSHGPTWSPAGSGLRATK